MKEYTTICNSAPSEFLASVALRNRATILARNLQIVKNNLPLYDDFFDKYADLFSWHKPNAGPIAFVKMRFDTDDMSFAKFMIIKVVFALVLAEKRYPKHWQNLRSLCWKI